MFSSLNGTNNEHESNHIISLVEGLKINYDKGGSQKSCSNP